MGFLLVDANNAFNEINRVRMIWTVRHLWPSGTIFFFKCYCNWSSLVLRNGNGTAIILHSREGVMQGDPNTIIAYGIRILPIIKNLKREITDTTNPWYDDYDGALGTFARLETYFDSLTRQGPGQGYQPDPTNSVLIIHPENIEAGKVFGRRHGFRVCMGAHYLGGFIGDNESNQDWLRECTLTWEKNINTIRKTAVKYLQESYATVVHEIQSEWIFLQHVTWDTGDAFVGVEKMIREMFFLIFYLERRTPPPVVGALSKITVKKTGRGLLNPVTSDQENYLSSTQGSAELVWDVTGGVAFSNADHLRNLSKERREGKKD